MHEPELQHLDPWVRDFLRAAERAWGDAWGHANYMVTRPVTLKDVKAEPKLAKMELVRQSRLSVSPVRDAEWTLILKLAG